MQKKIIIEGHISVINALASAYRDIYEIYIAKGKRTRQSSYVKKQALKKGVKVNFVSRAEIDNMATGNTHGGIIAIVSPRKFLTVADIINSDSNFVVYLDGVEDPYNLAYAVRTLSALNVDGLIINDRDWSKVSNIISKSSAGAWENLKIAINEDPEKTIEMLNTNKFEIICAAVNNDAKSMYEIDIKKPVLLVVGGEKRGISSLIIENTDKYIYIPYYNDNFKYSLPSCVAISLLSYQIKQFIN